MTYGNSASKPCQRRLKIACVLALVFPSMLNPHYDLLGAHCARRSSRTVALPLFRTGPYIGLAVVQKKISTKNARLLSVLYLNLLFLPVDICFPGGGWFSGWSRDSSFTVGCCACAVPALCRSALGGCRPVIQSEGLAPKSPLHLMDLSTQQSDLFWRTDVILRVVFVHFSVA